MIWTDLLREMTETLRSGGVASPRSDAVWLAAAASGLDGSRVRLRAATAEPAPTSTIVRARELARRRAQRIPLQHLVGAPFLSLTLEVGPGVLVPRPETELLAQAAIDEALARSAPRVVDVGTGTGAIAIAVAKAAPHAQVVALEPDPIAYTWARQNLRRYPDAPVELRRASAADLIATVRDPVDVLVSNPPYIPHARIPADPETRQSDPDVALYAGADGLDVIRDLVSGAARALADDGVVLIEHGEDQGARVRALCQVAGLADTQTHADLTGRARFTRAARGSRVQ